MSLHVRTCPSKHHWLVESTMAMHGHAGGTATKEETSFPCAVSMSSEYEHAADRHGDIAHRWASGRAWGAERTRPAQRYCCYWQKQEHNKLGVCRHDIGAWKEKKQAEEQRYSDECDDCVTMLHKAVEANASSSFTAATRTWKLNHNCLRFLIPTLAWINWNCAITEHSFQAVLLSSWTWQVIHSSLPSLSILSIKCYRITIERIILARLLNWIGRNGQRY